VRRIAWEKYLLKVLIHILQDDIRTEHVSMYMRLCKILSLLIISRPLQNKMWNEKQIIPHEDGPHVIQCVKYQCGVAIAGTLSSWNVRDISWTHMALTPLKLLHFRFARYCLPSLYKTENSLAFIKMTILPSLWTLCFLD
jgi:hypothetical protein